MAGTGLRGVAGPLGGSTAPAVPAPAQHGLILARQVCFAPWPRERQSYHEPPTQLLGALGAWCGRQLQCVGTLGSRSVVLGSRALGAQEDTGVSRLAVETGPCRWGLVNWRWGFLVPRGLVLLPPLWWVLALSRCPLARAVPVQEGKGRVLAAVWRGRGRVRAAWRRPVCSNPLFLFAWCMLSPCTADADEGKAPPSPSLPRASSRPVPSRPWSLVCMPPCPPLTAPALSWCDAVEVTCSCGWAGWTGLATDQLGELCPMLPACSLPPMDARPPACLAAWVALPPRAALPGLSGSTSELHGHPAEPRAPLQPCPALPCRPPAEVSFH